MTQFTSNLPTTLTNALVGAACVVPNVGLAWPRFAAAWFAVACFYLAGMALNDVIDADADRRERPERPIPSRRISRTNALLFAGILLTVGLVILGITSSNAVAFGAALVGMIVLYNLVHALTVLSVIFMGACRGLVYLLAAAAVNWPVEWNTVGTFALTMTIYTALVALIARRENLAEIGNRRWLAVTLPFLVVWPMVSIWPANVVWTLLTLALVWAWLSRGIALLFSSPPSIRQAIVSWIAGICLVDAFSLALLNRPALTAVAIGCFALTIAAHKRVQGS
jgi:4-hydroxybenzoate polyprenyltransferase